MPTNRVAAFGTLVLEAPVPHTRVATFGAKALYKPVVNTRVAEFGVAILRSYAEVAPPTNPRAKTRVQILGG